MALWVLHEQFASDAAGAVWRAYETDPFMLRLRAKNLMAHFLSRVSYPELAYGLAEIHPKLAAQIAGIAFERKVRQQAAREVRESGDEQDLSILINELFRKRLIDRRICDEWHEARRVRNRVIHKDVTPTHSQVESLLRVLNVHR
jgi:hypothetical protein